MPASRAIRLEFERLGLDHARAYTSAELHAAQVAHAAKAAAPAPTVTAPKPSHSIAKDVPINVAVSGSNVVAPVEEGPAPAKAAPADEVVVVASSKKGKFGRAAPAAPLAPEPSAKEPVEKPS